MKTKVRHVTLALVIVSIIFSTFIAPVAAVDSLDGFDETDTNSNTEFGAVDSNGDTYYAEVDNTQIVKTSEWTVDAPDIDGPITVSKNGEYLLTVKRDSVQFQDDDLYYQLRHGSNGTLIEERQFYANIDSIEYFEDSNGNGRFMIGGDQRVTVIDYDNNGIKNSDSFTSFGSDLIGMDAFSDTDIYAYEKGIGRVFKLEYSGGTLSESDIASISDFSADSNEIKSITVNGEDQISVMYEDTNDFTVIDTYNTSFNLISTVSIGDGFYGGMHYISDDRLLFINANQDLELREGSNLGNVIDSKTTSFTGTKIYSKNGNYMTISSTDTTKVYRIQNAVVSLDSKSDNNDSVTINGSEEFQINSTATFTDSSTSDVTQNVTYNYDPNTVSKVIGENKFYGVGIGTTDIQVSYTDSTDTTVTDNVTVTVDKPVESTELVYPLNDSTDLTGSESFQIATELKFKNGTTKLASDSDLSYSYDSTIIENTNDGVSNAETFEGINSGTTNIQSTYTGFDGETTTSNSDTVTVSDPAKVESVKIESRSDFTYDEGESKKMDLLLNLSDGSQALVTRSSKANFTSGNTTILTINESTGESTANLYGDVTIYASWYDSWYDNNVTTNTTATVLGDPTNLDYEVKPDEVLRDENVTASDMNAVLNYEDGRSEDITINVSDISSSDPANTVYDNQQNQVRFTQSNKTYTLTYTEDVTNVSSFSDSDTVTVNPRRDFEDYNNLGVYDRVFVIMSDWTFWAIILSLIAGSLVAIQIGTTAGIGTTTIIIAVAWAGGFVPIYIPISLILIEIFAYITKNSTGASTT